MEFIVTISEKDMKCLENDLIDVNEWIQSAVQGKISSCKDRMVDQWLPKLMNDPNVESLPADKYELVNMIILRSDYKNRKFSEENVKEHEKLSESLLPRLNK